MLPPHVIPFHISSQTLALGVVSDGCLTVRVVQLPTLMTGEGGSVDPARFVAGQPANVVKARTDETSTRPLSAM
jgi:hypothetical protein